MTNETIPSILSNVRAILFDIDGTLLDSREFIFQAVEHTLAHHGFVVPSREDMAPRLLGPQLPDAYAALAVGGDVATLIETHRLFQEQHLALCHAYPEAAEVLATLQQRGYRMAAVTSRSRRTSLGTLEGAGLLQLFEAVVSWEDTSRHKPDGDPLRLALTRLGVPSSQAVMVGDTWVDVHAGMDAGVLTVGVSYGYDGENIRSSSPDLVIAMLGELLTHLR